MKPLNLRPFRWEAGCLVIATPGRMHTGRDVTDKGLYRISRTTFSTTQGVRRRRFSLTLRLSHIIYLSISFRKSTPPQNRQLVVKYC